MAYNAAVQSPSKRTLVINDYTGSPVANTITNYVEGSLTLPRIDTVSKGEVGTTSTAGTVRYATPVKGLALGQEFSFQTFADDVKNNTDKNPNSLLRALAGTSVSATGHTAELYTNQLTGKGGLQGKLLVTETSEAAAANISTFPFEVLGCDDGESGGAAIFTWKCRLVGAITLS